MQRNIKSKWLTAFGVIFTACAALVGCKGANMMNANKAFNDEGEIKLAKAAQKGDVTAIKALVAEGVDPNAKTIDKYSSPLLMWALLHQNEKGLIALLEAGADPAGFDSDGRTVLHLAAMANDSRWLTLLLEYGLDPDMRNGKNGQTPLVDAIMSDNFDILLAAGADVNARSNSFSDGALGDAILHEAANSNSNDRVMDLLAAGADPTALDAHGDTFQVSFFMMNENIMTEEGKAQREQLRAWLRERNIPVEDGR
ncbi:hypothetical protein MNBD_GAMMA04-1065 [hydrothermal vent metagenome]|uniref:Uncharacterized protein n=1 Tax=hydrothermal vent metagenome TaxID=652676 RepID=A0A3B0WHX9_9ZZZZ